MNPFELALGLEAKKPMDLTIPRIISSHQKGKKQAKVMAKECENRKVRANKLLEKAQVSYEKEVDKSQRHIEFEVGDILWLNIRL